MKYLKIFLLLPVLAFPQIQAPSAYQRVTADTLSDTALTYWQVPPYLGGQSIKMRSMTKAQLAIAVGGGGGTDSNFVNLTTDSIIMSRANPDVVIKRVRANTFGNALDSMEVAKVRTDSIVLGSGIRLGTGTNWRVMSNGATTVAELTSAGTINSATTVTVTGGGALTTNGGTVPGSTAQPYVQGWSSSLSSRCVMYSGGNTSYDTLNAAMIRMCGPTNTDSSAMILYAGRGPLGFIFKTDSTAVSMRITPSGTNGVAGRVIIPGNLTAGTVGTAGQVRTTATGLSLYDVNTSGGGFKFFSSGDTVNPYIEFTSALADFAVSINVEDNDLVFNNNGSYTGTATYNASEIVYFNDSQGGSVNVVLTDEGSSGLTYKVVDQNSNVRLTVSKDGAGFNGSASVKLDCSAFTDNAVETVLQSFGICQ